MSVRRVVALAQALTMTTLLLPGSASPGPLTVQAAPRAADVDAGSSLVFDAAGRGVGCQPRNARFRGPKPPSDPPWPPGAEPTPTPEPSPSVEAGTTPQPGASDSPAATSAANAGSSAFLQAELPAQASAPPAGESGGSDADIAPDVPSRRARSGIVRGIDISHHNQDIDFGKVRRAGYDFVFIKASQDNDFIDPMFVTNMARARAAGLSAGGYHFFDYTLDGRVQADHFVDRLELADAIDGALPPVVDVECWAPIGASIHAVSAARLRDFVARVYERTGRLPIVYTSVFMWREVVGDAEGFEDQPLWAACWGCDDPPSIAAGWDDWAFWQTGVDRVRGVKKLDGNVFSGTVRQLRAMRLRPLSLASGAPVTSSQEVEVDLGGRDATHLRTSPDGATWSGWRAIRGAPTASIGAEEGSHTVYVQLRHGQGRPSPVYSDSIALDRQGPELAEPVVRLRQGPLGAAVDAVEPGPGLSADAVPVAATWTASDVVAGLGDAGVAVDCGAGDARRGDAPGAAQPGDETSWQALTWLEPGEDCQVRVTARDAAGNASRAVGGRVTARLHPVPDGGVGGISLEGDSVGVIARRGPDGGQATVSIDGQPVGVIDLFAPQPQGPEVVYVADLPSGSAGSVSLSALVPRDPTASGQHGAVEGFVTLATD